MGGIIEKRRAEDRGIANANQAVRDQIMGRRVYTGPAMETGGGLFSDKGREIFARNVARSADQSNYRTEGGVDNLQKLDLAGAIPKGGPTSGKSAASWTRGMVEGLGIDAPEDTRAAMMAAAKGQLNAATRQARVGDAQAMQASGMDDSGMALALNQQRTAGLGRDMANAAMTANQDYANRLEGYRNALMGSAQNYAQHADQYGVQQGQMGMQARSAEYDQNVWNPYQMKTGYLMGDAANQANAAAARRAGNMQMVSGLVGGAMNAGATLGSAGMNLAASKQGQQ